MIQLNELRYGNKMFFLGELVTFESIGKIRKDGIFWIKTIEHGELQHKSFHFKPIPLTDEWLLKFGFEKIENNWKVLDYVCFKLSWERLAGLVLVFDNESIFLPQIKYVHQLQNLYFALTGEELTLKPA